VGVTVWERRIVEIDILADPARLRELDLAVLEASLPLSPAGG
jgi:hypothetical protein